MNKDEYAKLPSPVFLGNTKTRRCLAYDQLNTVGTSGRGLGYLALLPTYASNTGPSRSLRPSVSTISHQVRGGNRYGRLYSVVLLYIRTMRGRQITCLSSNSVGVDGGKGIIELLKGDDAVAVVVESSHKRVLFVVAKIDVHPTRIIINDLSVRDNGLNSTKYGDLFYFDL